MEIGTVNKEVLYSPLQMPLLFQTVTPLVVVPVPSTSTMQAVLALRRDSSIATMTCTPQTASTSQMWVFAAIPPVSLKFFFNTVLLLAIIQYSHAPERLMFLLVDCEGN